MRNVLASLLLVGCISASKPLSPPGPNPALDKTITQVVETVRVIGTVVSLICSVEGDTTDVCLTLTHSMQMVAFAAGEAERLYQTYRRTGVGLELVHEAIDRVVAALDRLHEDTAEVRVALYGSDHPVATAYCTRCCGVVVEPSGKASNAKPSTEANPYLKQAPTQKAP
jgi:hypothetical protein